jgi:2-succinyl-5-enolpyruvyl-6-hydroxy-3-cyclohexene-1-carboxylate synthase
VVLTADRPPELRGTGAPQTIDQLGLYGTHVRRFVDLPCPGDALASPEAAAREALAACEAAMAGGRGPVHLNVPYREPLVPAPEEMAACEDAWRGLALKVPAQAPRVPEVPAEAILASLAGKLEAARRPLVLAGPEAVSAVDAWAVLALARAAGAPVFADIASGLRGEPVPEGAIACLHADLFLRDEALAAIAPDFILRLGGIPTSKTVATWLARHRAPMVAVQPDARRRDPDGVVGEVVVAPAAALCEALATRVGRAQRDEEWLAALQAGEAGARALAARAPREAAAVAAACGALPGGAALFLSSSMPIRWGEMYAGELPGGTEVFVNRGANGIDGIVSSAIGVALGGAKPTLLVTGDLAFLHDAGGLRAARALGTPLAILLLDNDGGGIFSHLPVARHAALFEPLFGTPQGCDLAAASRASGIEHVVAGTLEEVASLAGATLSRGGVRVIEWRTQREATLAEHAALTRLAGPRVDRVEAGGLAWRVRSRGLARQMPLVLLHGFTGTGEFWLPVAQRLARRRCVIPDLPGHGDTDAPLPPEEWRLDRAADALVAMLEALGERRFALAGYSMGARLALAVALRHPDRVAALALVGATPGIADAAEREARAKGDLDLAQSIEREGIVAFSRRWEANPLFATQAAMDPALVASMRSQRHAQHPGRLAAALRAFGTGFQPPAHEAMASLRMPVLLMAGSLDAKFAAIARDMASRIPGSAACLVPGAGHAVPLERAPECAREFERFLQRSIDA